MVRELAVVCCALAFSACTQQPRAPIISGPDVEAVRARDAALNAAIQHRDARAAAGFYALDGRIVERTPTVRTPIGPEASYAALFADDQSSMQLSVIEVEVAASRDLAVSVGECVIVRHQEGPVRSLHDECIKSWRRGQDDVWRIVTEARVPIAIFSPEEAPRP